MCKLPLRKLTKIWTLEAYSLLYTELVKQFGPYEQWEQSARPSKDVLKQYDYERWLEAFALVVGAESGEAVAQQIAFSTTVQPQAKARAHTLLLMKNKTMVYECGFIGSALMPETLSSITYVSNGDEGVDQSNPKTEV